MDDLAVSLNVTYAPGDRRSLDIYALRTPSRPRPVAIFFYGGGWTSGSKANEAWVGAALARRGFVAVVADYRLYPQARWPQFLEDNAAAVRWARDHAASYGGDPSALVLIGHSAGAFNAVSLAVDRRWLAGVGLDPGRDLKAVIGLSSPYMGLPMSDSDERAVFDVGNGFTEPMDHVDGHSPPLLFLVGDQDRVIDPHENDQLIAKVREKNGVAATIHYSSLGHDDTKNALGESAGPTNAPVMDDITHFLAEQGVELPPLTQDEGWRRSP